MWVSHSRDVELNKNRQSVDISKWKKKNSRNLNFQETVDRIWWWTLNNENNIDPYLSVIRSTDE